MSLQPARGAVVRVLLGALILAACASAASAWVNAAPSRAAKPALTDIYLSVEGSVAVEGAATGRLPVRYKGELLADAGGVPLMRGGRASLYDGRFDLNLFGVVADSCLSSNSLRPVFTPVVARARAGGLRVVRRRKVVMDLDAYVAPELAGYDCRSGDRPLGETVSLRFTGALGKAGLASVPLTATSPVQLASGKRGTLKVTARATIRRLRKP